MVLGVVPLRIGGVLSCTALRCSSAYLMESLGRLSLVWEGVLLRTGCVLCCTASLAQQMSCECYKGMEDEH